jgi:tetratricopeptide (TPR) repeat protein
MNASREISILLVLLTASCLLSACSSSDETKREEHPVEQRQNTNTNASSQAQKENAPNVHQKNDFVHGKWATIDTGAVNIKDTIAYQLSKHGGDYLDLHNLANYESNVTRGDLEILRTPAASYVYSLNLGGGLKLTDSDIEPLSSMKLKSLMLDGSRLNDLHALKGMNRLDMLVLRDNPITPEGVKVLAALPNLRSLDLQRSALRDSDLSLLYGMKNLAWLNLGGCSGVTQAGVDRLKAKLPHCNISFDASSNLKYKSGFGVLDNINGTLIHQGEYDEADGAFANSISVWEKGIDPPYELIAHGYLYRARCQTELKRPKAAVQMLMKCMTLYSQHRPDDSHIPGAAYLCAMQADQIGDIKTELAVSQTADKYWQRHPPSEHERGEYLQNQRRIGYCLVKLNQIPKARAVFAKALKYSQQSINEEWALSACKQGIAYCDYASGDVKSAISVLKDVMQSADQLHDQEARSEAAHLLAECYMKQGNQKEAEAILRSNLKLSDDDRARAVDYQALDKIFKEQQLKEATEKSQQVYKNVLGKH